MIPMMSHPIFVHLDDEVQVMLEAVARERGIDLAAYLRELATSEARRLRRERIRAQSKAVAAYVASSPEARAFYEDFGSLSASIEYPT